MTTEFTCGCNPQRCRHPQGCKCRWDFCRIQHDRLSPSTRAFLRLIDVRIIEDAISAGVLGAKERLDRMKRMTQGAIITEANEAVRHLR